jgi:2-dehydropantoate 2-reductase
MRISIMGAGGVGGYLGAKLCAAGNEVVFVARGAHLVALKSDGLILKGVEPLKVAHVECTDDPSSIGPVDVVLFCVKLYDTVGAAELIAPMVAGHTGVITLQNGIDSVPSVGAIVGAEQVLGGAAYFPANITAPGEVTYFGKIASKPHIAFGEPGGGVSQRANDYATAFRRAGIEVDVPSDTDRMLWEKFLLIAGVSASTTLCRANVGAVRGDPDMRWMMRESIEEAARVAHAAGVGLPADVTDQVMAILDANPADGKSSQLVDLENARRLELEGLSGAVVRAGLRYGVPTPVHRTVYAALKAFAD